MVKLIVLAMTVNDGGGNKGVIEVVAVMAVLVVVVSMRWC